MSKIIPQILNKRTQLGAPLEVFYVWMNFTAAKIIHCKILDDMTKGSLRLLSKLLHSPLLYMKFEFPISHKLNNLFSPFAHILPLYLPMAEFFGPVFLMFINCFFGFFCFYSKMYYKDNKSIHIQFCMYTPSLCHRHKPFCSSIYYLFPTASLCFMAQLFCDLLFI